MPFQSTLRLFLVTDEEGTLPTNSAFELSNFFFLLEILISQRFNLSVHLSHHFFDSFHATTQ